MNYCVFIYGENKIVIKTNVRYEKNYLELLDVLKSFILRPINMGSPCGILNEIYRTTKVLLKKYYYLTKCGIYIYIVYIYKRNML